MFGNKCSGTSVRRTLVCLLNLCTRYTIRLRVCLKREPHAGSSTRLRLRVWRLLMLFCLCVQFIGMSGTEGVVLCVFA
jgi:hypothetical protein